MDISPRHCRPCLGYPKASNLRRRHSFTTLHPISRQLCRTKCPGLSGRRSVAASFPDQPLCWYIQSNPPTPCPSSRGRRAGRTKPKLANQGQMLHSKVSVPHQYLNPTRWFSCVPNSAAHPAGVLLFRMRAHAGPLRAVCGWGPRPKLPAPPILCFQPKGPRTHPASLLIDALELRTAKTTKIDLSLVQSRFVRVNCKRLMTASAYWPKSHSLDFCSFIFSGKKMYQHRPQIAWKSIITFPQFDSRRFNLCIFYSYKDISGQETNINTDYNIKYLNKHTNL